MDDLNKNKGLEKTPQLGTTPEKMVSSEVIESKATELANLLTRITNIKGFREKLSSGFRFFFATEERRLNIAVVIVGISLQALLVKCNMAPEKGDGESQQAQITDVRGASAETLTENEKMPPVPINDMLELFGGLPTEFVDDVLEPALGYDVDGYRFNSPQLIKSQVIPFLENERSNAEGQLKPYKMNNNVRYLNTPDNRLLREDHIKIAYINNMLAQLYTFVGEKEKAGSVYTGLVKWMISELVQDQNDPNLRLLAARVYSANPSMTEDSRVKGSDRAIFEYGKALILAGSPKDRQEIAQEYADWLHSMIGEDGGQDYQKLHNHVVEKYKLPVG